MKTTKEDILLTSLKLFAESGFDAVSTGMIAEKLDITKGALYISLVFIILEVISTATYNAP